MFKNLSNLQMKMHLNGSKDRTGVVLVFPSIFLKDFHSLFQLLTWGLEKNISSSHVQNGSILEC